MVGIILARVILFFNYFLLFFDKFVLLPLSGTGSYYCWRPRKPDLKHVYSGAFTDRPAKNKVPQ
jgi:hypothetical protein